MMTMLVATLGLLPAALRMPSVPIHNGPLPLSLWAG